MRWTGLQLEVSSLALFPAIVHVPLTPLLLRELRKTPLSVDGSHHQGPGAILVWLNTIPTAFFQPQLPRPVLRQSAVSTTETCRRCFPYGSVLSVSQLSRQRTCQVAQPSIQAYHFVQGRLQSGRSFCTPLARERAVRPMSAEMDWNPAHSGRPV